MSGHRKDLIAIAVLVIIIVIGVGVFERFASRPICPIPEEASKPVTEARLTERSNQTVICMRELNGNWVPMGFLGFDARPDFASSKGFGLTWIENILHPVLVLPPSGSGFIPITLILFSGLDCTLSLDIRLAGWPNPEFKGVRYAFSPSVLSIKAQGNATSILSIEVDSNAPTAFYDLYIGAHVEGIGVRCESAFPLCDLLIYPYMPSWGFHVIGPLPGVWGTQTAPAYIETVPQIAVRPGEAVYIVFRTDKRTSVTHEPAEVNLDLTSDHGSLPSGVDGEFDSVQVAPSPDETVIILTLTTTTDVPQGTYRMVTTIKMGSYTTQRAFDLVVT